MIAGGLELPYFSLEEGPACLLENTRGSAARFLQLFSAHLGATFLEK